MKRSIKYFSKVLCLSFFFFLIVSIGKTNIYKSNYQNNFADSYAKKVSQENPLLILEIPKLKLVQNVYDIDSKLNNVKYHVAIMKESILPDIENSHLILAAHAGNSKISYFNNLNELDIKDIAIVTYQNKKYVYEVINKDVTLKENYVDLKIYDKTNILYLITCYEHDKRLVVTLRLKVIN